jgi:hypothetical protein
MSEAKKEPRKIEIPYDHIEKVVTLADNLKEDESLRNHYLLWQYLEKIIPEIAGGRWIVSLEGAHVFLLEKLV